MEENGNSMPLGEISMGEENGREVSIKLEESKFDRTRFEVKSLIVSSLNYDVVKKEGFFKKTEKRIRILHDVDLDIKTGTLTAILGPSGAGKVNRELFG